MCDVRSLWIQANLFAEEALAVMLRHGLRDSVTLLEVGCGQAFWAEQLLHNLPHSQVICLDKVGQFRRDATSSSLPETLASRLEKLTVDTLYHVPETLKARHIDAVIVRLDMTAWSKINVALLFNAIWQVLAEGGRIFVFTPDATLLSTTHPILPTSTAMHPFQQQLSATDCM